jgi:hypothetical protein
VKEGGLAMVNQDIHFLNQAPRCPTAIVIFLPHKPHRDSGPEQTHLLSGQHRYNPKPFSTAAILLWKEEAKHSSDLATQTITTKYDPKNIIKNYQPANAQAVAIAG